MSVIEPISMQSVSEKVILSRQGRLEEEPQYVVNHCLTTTTFVPLEERFARSKPELAACLAALKKEVETKYLRNVSAFYRILTAPVKIFWWYPATNACARCC